MSRLLLDATSVLLLDADDALLLDLEEDESGVPGAVVSSVSVARPGVSGSVGRAGVTSLAR